jgi:Ca-activated chloride channel homolog
MFYWPWAFLLLLILPVLVFIHTRPGGSAAIRFSSIDRFGNSPVSRRQKFRPVLFWLRLLCITLLIVALARPRKGTKIENISTEGVAMMITVDHSGSMGEQMSYQGQALSRIDVVKRVVADFVRGDGRDYKGRTGDMIGLVTYARYADTQCPLVRGNNIIVDFLKNIYVVDQRQEDGTAIGDGIALAAARLQKCEQQIQDENAKMQSDGNGKKQDPDFRIKSKVIILLTDGMNNTGQYSPMEAAKLAAEWGIKIYTIGIGSGEKNNNSFFGMMMPSLDENLLSNIANITGGFYARADNADQLREIYKKIDKLEKTEVKSVGYVEYAEQFAPWAKAGLGLLLLEIMASATVFRKIP